MLEIDGSVGEGGGQVLRTALSLSSFLGKGIRIGNIRAGRGNPGLQAQHLGVCNALAKITGAKVEGAALGSTEISFEPSKIQGGEYGFDIGTAGSAVLFLQALLPVLLHADKPSIVKVKGGTHVRGAPTFEYFSNVFLPAVRKMGAKCDARLLRAGFYPKGGGEIELSCEPSGLSGLDFGKSKKADRKINYSIISSGLPTHVTVREDSEIRQRFLGLEIDGEARHEYAYCPGNAVTLWSGLCGASSLGEKGKAAEKVAIEACDALSTEIAAGADVDANLADQLLVYAAIADGRTVFGTSHFSSHLRTNAETIRALNKRNIILGDERHVEVI